MSRNSYYNDKKNVVNNIYSKCQEIVIIMTKNIKNILSFSRKQCKKII